MNTPLFLGALLLVAAGATAQEAQPARALPLRPATAAGQQQEASQDDLIKKRDEKLQLAFLKKANWITDYDKAREEAKKGGKPIFAYFSRSYAH